MVPKGNHPASPFGLGTPPNLGGELPSGRKITICQIQNDDTPRHGVTAGARMII